MNNEISNVQKELSPENINHITNGNPPVDEAGKVIDLSALWNEYIDKELFRYEEKVASWLENQLTKAIPLYERDLETLQRKLSSLELQEGQARRRIPASIAEVNMRMTARNRLVRERPIKRQALRKAEAALRAQEKKVERIEKQWKKVPVSQQHAKKTALGWRAALKAKRKAADDAYTKRRQLGLHERSIIKLDLKQLRNLIKKVKQDVKQLKAYNDKVKSLSSKLEMQKLEQDMKWIGF